MEFRNDQLTGQGQIYVFQVYRYYEMCKGLNVTVNKITMIFSVVKIFVLGLGGLFYGKLYN